VDQLSDLQREVIRHRFGFDGSDPASLQTTAERMGIGVRKVRQAEAEALEILSIDDVLEAAHEAAEPHHPGRPPSTRTQQHGSVPWPPPGPGDGPRPRPYGPPLNG